MKWILKSLKEVGWNVKIVIFSLVIYGCVFLVNANIFFLSLQKFLFLISQIFLPLALVFIFLFLTNLYIDNKKLIQLFEKKKKLGWIIAIISGIISSGPIYLWYPLLSDLREKGVKLRYIACFLYNRSIKIPLLPIFIYYFGWKIVLVLSIYTIIFSVVIGILVEKICREQN